MKKHLLVPAVVPMFLLAGCIPRTNVPVPKWYEDADADGYGNAAVVQVAAEQPLGYVSNRTDCDDGDDTRHPGASDGVDGIDQDCDGLADNRLVIFSTSTSHPSDFGALTNADAICQQHADSPSSIVPEGTYKAWISSSTESAAQRLLHSVYPYVRADGQVVANNWDDLVDGSMPLRILYDETGVNSGLHNMTGTNGDGSVIAGATCNDWSTTSNGVTVAVGLNDQTTYMWTNYDWWYGPVTHYCGSYKLYCVQQGGVSRWYRDADSDGYGNVATYQDAATKPKGYVSDDTDCNDGRKTTYPGAYEYINGLDDDCDGRVDYRWYQDSDGDGYGDSAYFINSEENPGPGYSTEDQDCDDSDYEVNPGPEGELYEMYMGPDGKDNDCDGQVDEDAMM